MKKGAAAIARNLANSNVREIMEQNRGEPTNPRPRRSVTVEHALKEINPSLVVRTEKFLGAGTFGNCYLAYYRDLLVAVKEYKNVKSTPDAIEKEVCHEAKMISHLGDHCGVPLLFGVIMKSEPFRLITKFHGQKQRSLTLSRAIRKKDFLDKPGWLCVLKKLIVALEHIHSCGVLHNDLKANNIVLEKRDNGSINPVIINFGKARFVSDAKPPMSMTISEREEYHKRYPHIAPEIVCGSGRQSFKSDIFSFGKITLSVLDLLPTATARSIKVAKSALRDDPQQRPSIKEMLAAL